MLPKWGLGSKGPWWERNTLQHALSQRPETNTHVFCNRFLTLFFFLPSAKAQAHL